jgi:hypothetical protein
MHQSWLPADYSKKSTLDSLDMEEDIPDAAAFCVSRDPHRKKIGKTVCIHYEDAEEELGLVRIR